MADQDFAKNKEEKGDLEGAIRNYFISINIERYEACSYYGMLDMAKIFNRMKRYPEAIYFLKTYIDNVEREFSRDNPCFSGVADDYRKKLLKNKNEAYKMLKDVLTSFCLEVNDNFLCGSTKPYELGNDE